MNSLVRHAALAGLAAAFVGVAGAGRHHLRGGRRQRRLDHADARRLPRRRRRRHGRRRQRLVRRPPPRDQLGRRSRRLRRPQPLPRQLLQRQLAPRRRLLHAGHGLPRQRQRRRGDAAAVRLPERLPDLQPAEAVHGRQQQHHRRELLRAGHDDAATTSAFGVIFVDVEVAGLTRIEFFDAANTLIFTRDALVGGNQGLSFLGGVANAGERSAASGSPRASTRSSPTACSATRTTTSS